jgi:hypothetical protein
VFTTSGTYPWSFVTQIFHNGQPSHDGDGKINMLIVIFQHLILPPVFSEVRVT